MYYSESIPGNLQSVNSQNSVPFLLSVSSNRINNLLISGAYSRNIEFMCNDFQVATLNSGGIDFKFACI